MPRSPARRRRQTARKRYPARLNDRRQRQLTADPALAVGQKAIFYEERTSASEGSAEPGSIVWSLVQESPGGNLPPEPAIRAEATIPGKDVQLRMTIKRNADQSLPASHIIEMIFLTPDGFAGGGIDNILRVAMKGSEQEAGNPLIGIPAKIADGFFLVALNDSKAETDANLTLLRRQSLDRHSGGLQVRPPRALHHGKGHSRRQGVRRGAEGLGSERTRIRRLRPTPRRLLRRADQPSSSSRSISSSSHSSSIAGSVCRSLSSAAMVLAKEAGFFS